MLEARGLTKRFDGLLAVDRGLDEVPMAHKDIDEVMAAQRDLVAGLAPSSRAS